MEQVYIKGDKGAIVLTAIGEEAVLTAMARQDAKLGMIFLEMRRAAEDLSEIGRMNKKKVSAPKCSQPRMGRAQMPSPFSLYFYIREEPVLRHSTRRLLRSRARARNDEER